MKGRHRANPGRAVNVNNPCRHQQRCPLGALLTEQISNVLSDSIPEPAVVTLLPGAGGGLLASRRIFKRKPEEDDEKA